MGIMVKARTVSMMFLSPERKKKPEILIFEKLLAMFLLLVLLPIQERYIFTKTQLAHL